MDQRITLLQPTKANDGTTNAEVITYASAGTVRAERIFKNSSERYEAQQQVGTSTEEFRIRDYSSLYAITHQWRFTWDNKTFNVRGIEKAGRRNYLILTGEYRDN
jgi:SPP1 family predicted phage head-tail adaptor